jgi:hypothetical protein
MLARSCPISAPDLAEAVAQLLTRDRKCVPFAMNLRILLVGCKVVHVSSRYPRTTRLARG